MCRMCAGYKKDDVKTIEVWRAEQNKRQGVFAFSAKNWVLFCGDFQDCFSQFSNMAVSPSSSSCG